MNRAVVICAFLASCAVAASFWGAADNKISYGVMTNGQQWQVDGEVYSTRGGTVHVFGHAIALGTKVTPFDFQIPVAGALTSEMVKAKAMPFVEANPNWNHNYLGIGLAWLIAFLSILAFWWLFIRPWFANRTTTAV